MSGFLQQRYWTNLGWALLAAVTIVPMFILSAFNQPSAADDFCFAYMARDYGILWSTKFYYDQWTGRYFACLLFHSTPLFKGWFWYYKVLPIVYMLSTMGSVYLLLGELIKLPRIQKGLISLAFLILYIFQLESIVESFFWVTGSYTYALPQILTLLFWVALIRSYKAENRRIKYGLIVWAAFLVFAMIGLCEMFVILTTGMILCFLGYRLLFQRKLDWVLVLLFVEALICCYLVLESPGSKIRQAGNPMGGNIPFSIMASIKTAISYGVKWLPLTLVFSIFWIKFLSDKLTTSALFSTYVRIPVWVGWLVWAAVVVALYFPIFYGVGMDIVSPRITNSVYFFYLIGFFYNVVVTMLWIQEKWNLGFLSPGIVRVLSILAILSLPLFIWKNTNVRIMASDLKNGTAYQYNRELNERYEKIRQAPDNETVVIQPLKHVPRSLFLEDIKDNEKHPWNDCETKFFQKKALVLAPAP